MLECTSPAKRFPPKTVNEKEFLSTQSLTFVLTRTNEHYNKIVKYKVSKNKYTTDEDINTNKYTHKLRYT